MSVNVGMLRSVAAGLLALLLTGAAVQPAVAAPQRAEQWYLDELRIDQAHKLSTGRGVIVAVVDSGVDATHPDLRGQVLPGGRSYGASGDGRADEDGHGTHMAGIIAATNAATDGVDGIAPGAKILPIKIKKGGVRLATGAGPRHPDGGRRWRHGNQPVRRWAGRRLPGGRRAIAYALERRMSSWLPPPATPPRERPQWSSHRPTSQA